MSALFTIRSTGRDMLLLKIMYNAPLSTIFETKNTLKFACTAKADTISAHRPTIILTLMQGPARVCEVSSDIV